MKFFYDQNVKFNYSNSPTIFSTNILKNTSLIYEFGKIYRKILLKNLNTPHYQYLNSSLKTFSKYPLSVQRVSLCIAIKRKFFLITTIRRRMSSMNDVQEFIKQRETKFRKKREISFRFIVGQRIKANESVQAKMEWYIFPDSSPFEAILRRRGNKGTEIA